MRKRFFKDKGELRQSVWKYMEDKGLVAFPKPCFGRIPNFSGSRAAAEILKTLEEWQEAKVIFSAPDSPLRHARCETLKEGKSLLVVAPNITGFYLIEKIPPEKAFEASGIKGFSRYGTQMNIAPHLPKVDLSLTGAVAVDKRGNRIGKGSGFGDKEDDLLSEAGLIDTNTPRVALVHEVQVFDDFCSLMDANDRKVNIIVTPEKIYRLT